MRHLPQLIQFHRKQKGLSQSALAELSHVTQAMISKVESGREVTLSTMAAVVEALDLQLVVVGDAQANALCQQANVAQSKQSIFERIQVKDDE